jgi:uncharacterized protein
MSEDFQKPTRVWQRMISGKRLDLVDPNPQDIEITDISLGLSRLSRWNGQTAGGEYGFSVAQHSLLVESIFSTITLTKSNDESLCALLHDAAEYVIGDMISPFKTVVGGDYKNVEARLENVIYMRFGLASPSASLKNLIKQADNSAAFLEATQLAGFSQTEAASLFGMPEGFDIKKVILKPLSPQNAQKAFIDRFNMLYSG